jgi:hypothetical protein
MYFYANAQKIRENPINDAKRRIQPRMNHEKSWGELGRVGESWGELGESNPPHKNKGVS